ncbi:hypothetical protein [Butyrivibrio sp. INlla21]|uniref:hypothetical protein n=1 Tax=Butyrivibrio sp. INlla21 TaxID=1520811 RepID=UPI0008E6B68C|nr:hypothetical protein [Butyrivibrio sp. INlla21]SFU33046.1 hypothetical protein SAMN02910342_00104 [Butyrivibrio sp. INlla21]
MVELAQHQIDALKKMHNGCILRGDVGSGKSRTALAYYYIQVCKGMVKVNDKGSRREMESPRDLFIITTAKKRDDESWYDELAPFCITKNDIDNPSHVRVTIDSWNNIKKYVNHYGAFFIFDEQRVVGSGAWVKAFYKIAKKNQWILLTATPGDTWADYIPVFVANGFYRNKTEFNTRHAVYSRFAKYPKIERYVDTGDLVKYRRQILVNMKDKREAVEHHVEIICEYNKEIYRTVKKDRWDPYEGKPIEETGKLCYLERRVANEDPSRIKAIRGLLENNDRVIIFYNFDYELEILRDICSNMSVPFNEWNGHKHEPVPDIDRWAYLVQYAAGCEAWNCITTNVIIFYSQNYSYKVMTQSAGRINRMNTPYKNLYYYHLRSYSQIDLAIKRALALKKNFNEKSYLNS